MFLPYEIIDESHAEVKLTRSKRGNFCNRFVTVGSHSNKRSTAVAY